MAGALAHLDLLDHLGLDHVRRAARAVVGEAQQGVAAGLELDCVDLLASGVEHRGDLGGVEVDRRRSLEVLGGEELLGLVERRALGEPGDHHMVELATAVAEGDLVGAGLEPAGLEPVVVRASSLALIWAAVVGSCAPVASSVTSKDPTPPRSYWGCAPSSDSRAG